MERIHLPLGHYQFILEAIDGIYFKDYSGSAWRGLFGHALKQTVCVTHERQCSDCMLCHSCVYAWIFETPPPENTELMRRYSAAPHPFILSPDFSLRRIPVGKQVAIGLTLVGKANQYLPYVVEAFRRMGKEGIGPSKGRFSLIGIDQQRDPVQDRWHNIYQDGRLQPPEPPLTPNLPQLPISLNIEFITPLRMRSEGRLVNPDRFNFKVLFSGLLRRVSQLSYFHADKLLECDYRQLVEQAKDVSLQEERLQWYDWTRYSSRQKVCMKMGGMLGSIKLNGKNIEPFWPVLHIGQWLHAGKGAVMGLGKYQIHSTQDK